MPGSQQMNSIDLAYFLYKWRWIFRGLFAAMIFIGLFRSQWKRKWLLFFPIAIVAAVIYMTNFVMAAIYVLPTKKLLIVSARINKVDSNRLVLVFQIMEKQKHILSSF